MIRREAPLSSVVAYFSMEIALEPQMPTYSGGLGVLAGDTLRAAADLGVSMVAVTLLQRKGYFRQHLDESGTQTESPAIWSPKATLERMSQTARVTIEGREVRVHAWRYAVQGVSRHQVPVYLLDTDDPENDAWDRSLTENLYGGDERYRLAQEIVLGMGGVGVLRALGYGDIEIYHMNEGHCALLTLALLEEQTGEQAVSHAERSHVEAVRRHCVFTTHTPVPAGHDQFSEELSRAVLGDQRTGALIRLNCFSDGALNMTFLAMFFSRYINGVSMRHEQLSQDMFPTYPINSVSNGVHAVTWTSAPFRRLFDRHIPEWRYDNLYLRYAVGIDDEEIRQAHEEAKRDLLAEVERRSGAPLDPKTLTLGFARRATAYKRADMLLEDLERLKRMAQEAGGLQIVYAGKAHPQDEGGKEMIRRVYTAAAQLRGVVPVVYLEEYDMSLAALMCSGVDLWVNTPRKPQEASGTSGMKAALNGVPSLSTLDGWWIEGHVEGVTGWAIGETWETESDHSRELNALYDKLEHDIMPMFYRDPSSFTRVMRSAIAINGCFFNAQRMMVQYIQNAYRPD